MITHRRLLAGHGPVSPAALRGFACLAALTVVGCAGVDAGHQRPAPPPSVMSAPPTARWQPAVGTAWQWQLSEALDLRVDVPVYDVDGQTTTTAQVNELHRLGRRVICYVSVGSWEPGRPDAAGFPADVVGNRLEDFPDERWLDVRRLDVLLPLVEVRLRTCRDKGFDAVEPDNVDGYANDSGFPLSAEDQLRYNREIARLAHGLGLGVGLKNDGDQVPALEPTFDFAVVEQCAQYDECDRYRPFVAAGKAVLEVEYERSTAEFCPVTKALGFSGMRKNPELDAYREPCPAPTPASS